MGALIALILLAVSLVTGFIWLLDSVVFSAARQRQFADSVTSNSGAGELLQAPKWIEKSQQIFPTSIVLLFANTVVFNPFQISLAVYFSLFLVVITVSSGLIWLYDHLVAKPKRQAVLDEVESKITLEAPVKEKILEQPVVADVSQQIFPVIAFVLILRSFIYEPFQIPSGSMEPTLLVGDFILVEKFTYGLRDPVARKKFVELGEPERGDVVVFKYPEDERLDYIKRVVGLPGDKVILRNNQIFIKPACESGENCPEEQVVKLKFQTSEGNNPNYIRNRYIETLGEVKHEIYRVERLKEQTFGEFIQPGFKKGEYLVPEGQYFVLGDNRDNSGDSRFWGFVPEENLVGKAVAIWISFEFERQPEDIIPTWIPSGVRFNRVGGII